MEGYVCKVKVNREKSYLGSYGGDVFFDQYTILDRFEGLDFYKNHYDIDAYSNVFDYFYEEIGSDFVYIDYRKSKLIDSSLLNQIDEYNLIRNREEMIDDILK